MARKFVFAAAKVLHWYRQSLATEQLKLQRHQERIRELDISIESLEVRRTREKASLHNLATFQGRDLQDLAAYIAGTDGELARLKTLRLNGLREMEEQRQRVASGHRRVRLLEKLEERKRGEWLQALNLEETAEAADLFLASMLRDARERESAPSDTAPRIR